MAEPLGQMVIELGLDSSAFGRGLSGAKQQVKYAMAEMKSGLTVMSQSGKQVDLLSTKQRGLTNVISAQEKVVKSLKTSYDNSFVNGKATEATGRLGTQLQNATSKLNGFRNQLANNASALAQAEVQTEGWTGSLNKVSSAATNAGSKMTAMGSSLTTKLSAPIALGLGVAAKAAVDFDSQISAMGPLLTNGGAVTAKFKAQLDELGNSSKNWSTQYGISTTSINNAMSEMIKRGFTTKQVMGAMPAVLDASVASGEDLGTVMQATASIVEQFGLKANSTAQTTKNTQRVTDALTYSANATAAGFGDMSEAMSYVGPVAQGLGLSVEETAAAIGILSNRGIEGEKAGTNLRGMLTSLVKPTKQNTAGFTAMGISAEQLKKDSSDLPQLIRDITKGTEGWSKADRSKAIAQAFGRENQAAVNALVESGADSLGKLTTATENSSGATKKVADQLNDTKANQIKRFQSAVQVLGITFGEELLPSLTPIVKEATHVVKAFADMDEGTRKFIVHAAMVTAAAGPVLKVTGELSKGFGFIGGGVVNLIAKYAGFKAKSDVLNASMNTTDSATKSVNSTLANVNGTVNTAKTSYGLLGSTFLATGSQAGVLGTALSPLGAAIIGGTVAVAAGVTVWELWGKKAFESAQRTSEWGYDVGAQADESLQKFQNFSSESSAALQTWSTNGKTSAKTVKDSFSDMYSQIKSDSQTTNSQLDKDLKNLDPTVAAIVKSSVETSKKANQEKVKDAEATSKKASSIIKASASNDYKLSSDSAIELSNLNQKMAEDELSVLGVKNSKKKQILAAMNNDVKNMSFQQLDSTKTHLIDTLNSENASYEKQKKVLKSMNLAPKEYQAAIKALGAQHTATQSEIIKGLYNTMKAQKLSTSQMKQGFEDWGVSWKTVKSVMQDAEQSASKSNSTLVKTSSGMSDALKKAANTWNDIVFDPKTGKVKTNAKEEVNKATKSSKKWNAIMFLAKEGKLSTNAAEMVAKAAVENDKWDSMTWKEQKAVIKPEGVEDFVKEMEDSGEWNDLTLEEKEAIVTAKGQKELQAVIAQYGIWDSLTVKEKDLVVKDKATQTLISTLETTGQWNNLTVDQKTAVMNAKGGSELINITSSLGIWNDMPTDQKEAAFDSAKAKSEIVSAVGDLESWNALTPATQQLLTSSNSPEVVAKGIHDIGSWNSLPTSVKTLLANDSQASAVLEQAGINVDKYKLHKPGTKELYGDSKNLDQTLADANIKLGIFGQQKPAAQLGASDNTKPAVDTATTNVLGVPNKTAGVFASNNTQPGVTSATGTINSTPNHTSGLNANNNTFGPVSNATTSINGIPDHTSHLKANKSDFDSKVASIEAWLHHPITKTINIVAKKIGKFEKGTNNFGGGLAIVNDQAGSTYREYIEDNGVNYIPQGRNVVLPLGRHAKVHTASKTARMFPGLPQFAKGLNVPSDADIVRQPKQIVQEVQSAMPTQSDNSGIIAGLANQVQTLTANLSALTKVIQDQTTKEVAVYIDNSVVMNKMAPLVTKAQQNIKTSNNMIRGVR
jgi:TP901 family phage tail tape measure protein